MTDFSKTKIQFRRGSDSEFSSKNTILNSGEPGYAVDTKVFKIGDAQADWQNLPNFVISDTANIVGSSGIINMVYISSGDYAALSTYDPKTIYFIN